MWMLLKTISCRSALHLFEKAMLFRLNGNPITFESVHLQLLKSLLSQQTCEKTAFFRNLRLQKTRKMGQNFLVSLS